MESPSIEPFKAIVAKAHADGGHLNILDWWCEIGRVVHELAVRSRASVFDEGEYKVAVLPLGSSCFALEVACHRSRPRRDPRTYPLSLSEKRLLSILAARQDGEPDVVLTATNLLARCGMDPVRLSRSTAVEVTERLLACVEAVALELEASAGTSPRPMSVAVESDHDRTVFGFWDDSPAPRPGREVNEALAQCWRLAKGRLFSEALH